MKIGGVLHFIKIFAAARLQPSGYYSQASGLRTP
jgi:hypothetical protein